MVLSERIREMEESATILMAEKARELKAQGHDIISLSLGEPDFDTPEHIKMAAIGALEEGRTKYTPVPGTAELRDAIVRKFKRDNGLDFTRDQIVVSNGAKQCIANVVMSIIDPGDEVILFSPYWVSYYEIIRLAGGVPIPLYAGVEQDYKISPDQLRQALNQKTKAIIFSSPCNPTGSVYTKEELEQIVDVAYPNERIHFIADEIYEYINFLDHHISIASIDKIKERTITVNGFSKGYSMTGWRLGYMAAPLEIAKACAKIQGQFTSGANSFSQWAAITALEGDQSSTYKMRDEYHKRRDLILSLIKDVPGFKSHIPQGAFYIFPDVSELLGKSFESQFISTSDDLAMYLLEEAHVATVGGTAFGAPNCLRISYATSETHLREAVRRIAKATAQLV